VTVFVPKNFPVIKNKGLQNFPMGTFSQMLTLPFDVRFGSSIELFVCFLMKLFSSNSDFSLKSSDVNKVLSNLSFFRIIGKLFQSHSILNQFESNQFY